MSPDLNAIRVRAEQYDRAIGPGGEKAWLAGLLATDVPKLLAEIDQLTETVRLNHEGADYAEELLQNRDVLIRERERQLAAVEQDRDRWRDRCDGQAWQDIEHHRDRLLSALRELCDSGDATGRLIHPGQLRDLIRPYLPADEDAPLT